MTLDNMIRKTGGMGQVETARNQEPWAAFTPLEHFNDVTGFDLFCTVRLHWYPYAIGVVARGDF